MVSRSGSNVSVGVLAVVVAVVALACNSSSSPTTPVKTESKALQLSASTDSDGGAVGTQQYVFEFGAVALEAPQLITADREQYIRVVVSYHPISGGSEQTGVFRFFGNRMREGAALSKGDEFYAKVKEAGEDGLDWSIPAFRVLKIELLGSAD